MTRRAVQQSEPEDTSGRIGCIAIGAGLGIVAGVLFVFFGLSPTLNFFFGPTDIDPGEAFEAQGKTVRVVSVSEAPERTIVVTLAVSSNVTWTLKPDDFELELRGQEARVKALPPSPDLPDTSLALPLGEQRTVVLRFAVEAAGAQPVALHLRNPSLIFHLVAK